MRRYRDVVFVSLPIITIALILIPTLLGAIGPLPPIDVRDLAKTYLYFTLDIYNKSLWAASPEAVTAIVWDYRGLDTFYETIVFYTAIIGCLALYREVVRKPDRSKGEGLSIVVKKATAIAMLGIVAVGASTVLHGMLTPGGGFQGGSIIAVAPVLAIVVFSRILVDYSKITYEKAIMLRNLSIIGIALTALAPLIISLGNAFIFQNQVKAYTTFSYPSSILDVFMGGSLWFLNLFEGIAVSMAFFIAFKVLLYTEETSKEVLIGEDYGY
ncbi:MAG: MnhB domain-containing protein [Ignisphaera sp.]